LFWSIVLSILDLGLVNSNCPMGELTCLMYGDKSVGVELLPRYVMSFLFIFFLIEYIERYYKQCKVSKLLFYDL
jgi:hypothetical protein